jgi:hypothetical protein
MHKKRTPPSFGKNKCQWATQMEGWGKFPADKNLASAPLELTEKLLSGRFPLNQTGSLERNEIYCNLVLSSTDHFDYPNVFKRPHSHDYLISIFTWNYKLRVVKYTHRTILVISLSLV